MEHRVLAIVFSALLRPRSGRRGFSGRSPTERAGCPLPPHLLVDTTPNYVSRRFVLARWALFTRNATALLETREDRLIFSFFLSALLEPLPRRSAF